MDINSGKYMGESDNLSMSDIVNELVKKGYTIETVPTSGITIDNSLLTIQANETATVNVTYEGSKYYLVVKDNYYEMSEKSKGGISISKKESEIADALTANITTGSNVTIGEINGRIITLNAGGISGSSVVTISYGEYTETCNVTVSVTPTDATVATNTTPNFSTDYGLVDVIWLKDSSNTISTTPNEPNLYTSLGNTKKLTPVTWSKTTNSWTEDSTAKSTWYSYTADSGSDGKADNTTGMWANAKNSDGSYFVWIPRYAYRITYYSDSSYDSVTGYYDGWGMWDAVDGTLSYGIDAGIETVEYNENKYIVHPSFMGIGSENIGGGFGTNSNGITGFWVAKYEMSRTGATASSEGSGYSAKFLSVPNVRSAKSITIGNIFNVSKTYDSDKVSHLMKNSEWGAVAYLTQSKYGRNGHEIDINNSSTYITGNGGGAVGGSATAKSGTANAYNTVTGAKASTTGNIYGIYDMSGGAYEFVACFDAKGSSLGNGNTFASSNGSSSKYATAYSNGTTDYNSLSIIYSVGLIGDATKEVRQQTNSKNWFLDDSQVVGSSNSFLARGGYYNDSSDAGVFCADYFTGASNATYSFRLVLSE